MHKVCAEDQSSGSDVTFWLAQGNDIRLRYGRVTMLINNAGVSFGKDIVDSDCKEIDTVIRTNVMGPIWVSSYTNCPLTCRTNINFANVLRGDELVKSPILCFLGFCLLKYSIFSSIFLYNLEI